MYYVLSQQVDDSSSHSGEEFSTYHFPGRYNGLLHTGDVFVLYKVNLNKPRCYYGTGVIGEIYCVAGEFHAKLLHFREFEKEVQAYLEDGRYIEQLDYGSVRKNENPPWNHRIRPLSEKAYQCILSKAGNFINAKSKLSVQELEEGLKKVIRQYFVEKDDNAILEIERIAGELAEAKSVRKESSELAYWKRTKEEDIEELKKGRKSRVKELLLYCEEMKMSYSYKPLLVLALLDSEKPGKIAISDAARYFKDYYDRRRKSGAVVEKKRCIYLNPEVSLKDIEANIIANPVKALEESGFFVFN